MDAVDQLLERNRGVADALAPERSSAAGEPQLRVAIVTCMDARIDVYAALGLKPGEAHVLRNAGGVVSDDVIRSLAISQRRLGTREVMLVHHSNCGMLSLSEDGFRSELLETAGVTPSFAIEAFTDIEADVRQSIVRVRTSPFLPHRDSVRGFVFDVEEQRLREVAADGAGDAAASTASG